MRRHVDFHRPKEEACERYGEILDEVILQAAVHVGWDQVLGRLRRLPNDHPLAREISISAGKVRLLCPDPEVCLRVIDEIIDDDDAWLRGMLTSVVCHTCGEMHMPPPPASAVSLADESVSHWFG